MKRILAIVLTLAMVACLFVACGGDETPSTGTKPVVKPTTQPTTQPTDPTQPADPWADYETITIAEALQLCEQFVDAPSTDRYYIVGTVKEIQNAQFGQMIIEDETGEIMVYGSYSADGAIRYDAMTEKPVVGDVVLFHGTLQNYKGNTKEIQNGRIIDFIPMNYTPEQPKLPDFDTELTIEQILELPLSDNQITEGRYYIRATIDSISNAQYGSMYISDATGTISVYGSYNADGTIGYANMTDKPVKGDEVLLYATIKNFKGTLEVNSAWIIEFTHNEIDESQYTEMSIDAARKTETGTLVKVTGTVAAITYANGQIPSGIILVDGTNSIYVYDRDLAGSVQVGNTITVCASKTYWILDTEAANAEKFGYKGCNQLENAWLISNDNGNTEFNKSWITTTTVKDILDTPVTEDISTQIYKVTALIKEVPGNGFTNFYINDLDGTTGTYAYSQCNGADFAWLRQFDGKICTVYVMALNAKSTGSDCYWRFLPVAVIDEGFDASSVNFAENAVKYYGATQFLTTYSGDPAMEVLTKVSNELLGYTDIALNYASSDTDIVYFEEKDGKVIMHCKEAGIAKITISATANGKTYSQEVEITVNAQSNVEYVDVNTAIGTAVGETVTVKGIVAASLVNRTGFYLIDETGVIAIITDAATLAELKLGYEVVLTGKRHINTKGGTGYFGQSCIIDAEVVVNNYGNHQYPTDSFAGEITVEEFYNLDIAQDFTTKVYTMTCYVVLEETAYYSNLYLGTQDTYSKDEGTFIRLYSSSASQYSWLNQFAGQQITVEIAPCNWNDKNYYTGCVLAVVLEDGTRIVNDLNFRN